MKRLGGSKRLVFRYGGRQSRMTTDGAQTACGRLDWKWQNRTVGGAETEEGT